MEYFDNRNITYKTGLAAINVKHNGSDNLHYVATDHLGSIVQVLASNGNLLEEANYDPWGRYRKPDSWVYPKQVYSTSQQLTLTFRGYTGHEMLPEFGLINMNGRMYDPILGRMLSPDNYVQNPGNPQSYNRYAYALNNPLKYTDPDGEWVSALISAAVGGMIGMYAGGVIANEGELNPRSWDYGNWKTPVYVAVGGGIGSALGYLTWAAFSQGGLYLGAKVGGASLGIGGIGTSNQSFQWTSNTGQSGSTPINNSQNTSNSTSYSATPSSGKPDDSPDYVAISGAIYDGSFIGGEGATFNYYYLDENGNRYVIPEIYTAEQEYTIMAFGQTSKYPYSRLSSANYEYYSSPYIQFDKEYKEGFYNVDHVDEGWYHFVIYQYSPFIGLEVYGRLWNDPDHSHTPPNY